MQLLEFAFRWLCVFADIAEAVGDFLSWRDDWNRTWSPASYFIALFSGVILVFVVGAYGGAAWQSIAAALPW